MPDPSPIARSPLGATETGPSTPGSSVVVPSHLAPIGPTLANNMMQTLPSLQAGQTLGSWILDRPLGSGAFADVWLGRYCAKGLKEKQRVLKFLKPVLCTNRMYLATLEREAEALCEVAHPNVVRLYGIHSATVSGSLGTEWTWYFLELNYDESLQPLDAHVLAHGHIRGEALDDLARQLAEGLGAVHERGFLHLDLSPRNVLIGRTDSGFKALLCDFGLATRIHELATCPPEGRGTPGFAAPELATHAAIASDLFSLGAVLAWAATGETSVQGFQDRATDVSAWLTRAIPWAMSQSPNQRPRSWRSFLEQRLPWSRARWLAGTAFVSVVLVGFAAWWMYGHSPPKSRPSTPVGQSISATVSAAPHNPPPPMTDEIGRVQHEELIGKHEGTHAEDENGRLDALRGRPDNGRGGTPPVEPRQPAPDPPPHPDPRMLPLDLDRALKQPSEILRTLLDSACNKEGLKRSEWEPSDGDTLEKWLETNRDYKTEGTFAFYVSANALHCKNLLNGNSIITFTGDQEQIIEWKIKKLFILLVHKGG